MKNVALLLAVLFCFCTVDAYCSGGKETDVDKIIKDLQIDVANLQKDQEQIALLKQKIDSLSDDPSLDMEILWHIYERLSQLQTQFNSLKEQVDNLNGPIDDPPQAQAPKELAGRSNRLMHNGSLKLEAVGGFIRLQNPKEKLEDIMELLRIYKEEADKEGVNYDIAIAQMCRATNYLVWINNSYNYAGFYSEEHTIKFNNKREGVLAHIQHLKAYASSDAIPKNQLVDPRYDNLEKMGLRNTVVTFDQLYAKWAPQNEAVYRKDITEILTNLYKVSDNY